MESIDSLSPDGQALLLGLEAAGYDDVPAYRRFFARSLSSYQNQLDIDSICQNTVAIMERMREHAGADFLRVFSQTGLSFRACSQIHSTLAEYKGKGISINRFPRNGNEVSPVLLEPLVQSIIQVPELQGRVFKTTPRQVPDAQVVADWMNGRSYNEIAQTYFGDTSAEKALGSAVRYVSDASTWLSWGFGTCYLLIQTMFEGDSDEELGCLPLYVRFGVQQPVAAFCSLLGVTDRHVANQLAKIYPARPKGGLPRFSEVEEWLGKLSSEELERLSEGREFRAELIFRDLGKGWLRGPQVERLVKAQVRMESLPDRPIRLGEHFELQRRRSDGEEFLIVTRKFWGQSSLPFRDDSRILELARGRPASIFGFVIGADDTAVELLFLRKPASVS